jgi:hypothetical protein
VIGGGTVLGSAKNSGLVVSEESYTAGSTTLGSSSFDLKSAGSGFVDTNYGGVMGKGMSGVSGTSSELVKGVDDSFNGDYYGVFGESTSGGSSVASAAGAFDGKFTPLGASGETGGFGSGTGSLKVTGSGTLDKVPGTQFPVTYAATSGGGRAQTSAGGSAKGFNDMNAAGGRGFGSAQGNATGAIDAPTQRNGVSADSASTGTFTGIGSGSSGNGSNQPYSGGFVNGKGSGAGTAVVNSLVEDSDLLTSITGGDAAFQSNGVGAGFVDSTNGGAVGTASADVSGAAAGKTGGFRIEIPLSQFTDPGSVVAYGRFSVSGNAAANGDGAFAGGFSPLQASGPTGGSGSGTGSINVAGAGSGAASGRPTVFGSGTRFPSFPLIGTAVGSGTAQTSSGGSASGFNNMGSAGGLGSGGSQGSANGAISAYDLGNSTTSGAANTTGTFNNAGSGSFGSPSPSRAFP